MSDELIDARARERQAEREASIGDENAQLGGRAVAIVSAVSIVGLAFWALAQLWAPLTLAAWTAALLSPLNERVNRRAGGRRVVGAAVSVVLLHLLLVPVGVLAIVVGSDAFAFARQLLQSNAARAALESVVTRADAGNAAPAAAVAGTRAMQALQIPGVPSGTLDRVIAFVTEHSTSAWGAVRGAAGAGASAILAILVFEVSVFTLLSDGARAWAWAEEHAPISRTSAQRLTRAFHETGRGIIVGAGLTGLVQGVIAAIFYAALGVPRALVLGALTAISAFVPGIGTALVWAPVSAGLALTGHPGKAAILALGGLFGIGTIDNVVRPIFQRWGGNLDLPASVLLFSAFGGLAAYGPKGLLLGPIAVRMAREVLEITRDARAARRGPRIVMPDDSSKVP